MEKLDESKHHNSNELTKIINKLLEEIEKLKKYINHLIENK